MVMHSGCAYPHPPSTYNLNIKGTYGALYGAKFGKQCNMKYLRNLHKLTLRLLQLGWCTLHATVALICLAFVLTAEEFDHQVSVAPAEG